jgi:hypothetical protein
MTHRQAVTKSKQRTKHPPAATTETDEVQFNSYSSHDLTPGNILHLQRTLGNQAVQGLLDVQNGGAAQPKTTAPSFAWLGQQRTSQPHATLQRCGSCEDDAHHKPKVQGEECNHEDEEMHKPKLIQRDPTTTTTAPVPTTVIPTGPAWDASKTVVPSFVLDKPAAIRSNTASSTTQAGIPSLPTTFIGHAAVDAAGKTWRYQLDSVESKGKIQIVYFTSDRYPAPTPTDDSGALTNVTSANWKTIVKDLKDNRTGIPDHWSAYLAEDLHEDFHWKGEWQPLAIKAVQDAEKEIAKLSLGFDQAATATDAEAILKPQAQTLFTAAIRKARSDWAAMGDSEGDPPYIAQAPALDNLKARVEQKAAAEKWDTP